MITESYRAWEAMSDTPPDDPLKCACGYCGGPMRKRTAKNDPAYCTYECGVNAQPDKAASVMSNTHGSNVA